MKQSTETNKKVIQKLYLDCLNTGELELLPDIIHEDYFITEQSKGPEAYAEGVREILSAFPDIQFCIDDLITEGDKVVVRWTWTGTHKGKFKGTAPTFRTVNNKAIVIFKLKDNKVIESWSQIDRLEVLQQIGAIPQKG